MRKLISNKAFVLGFSIGILFFLCANILTVFNRCHHCVTMIGFPVVFYKEYIGPIYWNGSGSDFTSNDFTNFSIFRLVANIFVVVLSSISLGLVFKFVWSKLASQRLNLK